MKKWILSLFLPWLLLPSLCLGWGEVTKSQLKSDLAGYGADLVPGAVKRVETVAALRLLSGVADNQAVQLQGYAAAGDGGGGPLRYWIDGAAPGTYVDNGGSVIVPTGGDGSAAWLWMHAGDIEAAWFGADTTGSADSTTAVQKAYDYAYANARHLVLTGSVKLGQLTFEVAPVRWLTIYVKGDVTFTGAFVNGLRVSWIGSTSTAGAGYLTAGGVARINLADDVDGFTLSSDCRIENIGFYGSNNRAVVMVNKNNIHFKNVAIIADNAAAAVPLTIDSSFWIDFDGLNIQGAQAHDQPSIRITSTAAAAENLASYLLDFQNVKIWYRGIVIDSTRAISTNFRDIRFRNIDFEVRENNAFRFALWPGTTLTALEIDQLADWDAHLGGAGYTPLFHMTSGPPPQNIMLRNCNLPGGQVADKTAGALSFPAMTFDSCFWFYTDTTPGDILRTQIINDPATRAPQLFGPVGIPAENLSGTDLTGIAAVTGVTAPDGSATAYGFNTTGVKTIYSGSRTLAVGDWIIAGMWLRGETTGGWPRAYVNAAGFTFEQTQSAVLEMNSRRWSAGSGWQWHVAAGKIATIGTNPASVLFQSQKSTVAQTDIFGPVVLHIASGTYTDAEVGGIVGRLQQLPQTASAGSAALMPHQRLFLGGLSISQGTGTPEGAVSATVGSLYLRADGGAGTSLYVKQSGGNGNTGWVGK